MPASPPHPLDEGVAHLYYVRFDGNEDLGSLPDLLTGDEQKEKERFAFRRHQHQYVLSRALVRTALSYSHNVHPAHWRFCKSPFGRPEVADPVVPGLQFNLSHTTGLLVCLVARTTLVGVDVEDTARPGNDFGAVAERHYSRSERELLLACPPQDRHERFFALWTLKEAYLKALGLGLQIPLSHLSFGLLPQGTITLSLDPLLNDDPSLWQFALIRPTPRHLLASALRNKPGQRCRLLTKALLLQDGALCIAPEDHSTTIASSK